MLHDHIEGRQLPDGYNTLSTIRNPARRRQAEFSPLDIFVRGKRVVCEPPSWIVEL